MHSLKVQNGQKKPKCTENIHYYFKRYKYNIPAFVIESVATDYFQDDGSLVKLEFCIYVFVYMKISVLGDHAVWKEDMNNYNKETFHWITERSSRKLRNNRE